MSRTLARASRQRTAALTVALLAFVGILAIAAFLVTRASELPPASPGYSILVGMGIQPSTSAERAAAIARHYLDAQTPELAAPGIHSAPVVSAVSAVRAADATALEPRIPVQAIADDPGRVVWIVAAGGDFLNLHDLPWSSAGDPYPSGSIVVDDATGTILGVYPPPSAVGHLEQDRTERHAVRAEEADR